MLRAAHRFTPRQSLDVQSGKPDTFSEIDHKMIEQYELSPKDLALLHQAELNLHQQVDTMKAKDDFPGEFPTEDMWRFLMDHKDQAKGKCGYENERGYMAGMMRGFTMMLQHLGERLTPESYELLHDECVDDVYDTQQKKIEKSYNSPFE